MKFQYWRSKKDGQWYWHLISTNQKILAVGGEGFVNENDLKSSINLVRNGATTSIVQKLSER